MAGAYCRFCDNRCFVLRVIPDGPEKGWQGHMATCARGMAHDFGKTGHTHETAINPVTDPDAATAVYGALAVGTVISSERGVSPHTISSTHPGRSFVFEPISVGDTAAQVWIGDAKGDGPSINLTPGLLRHIAAQLIRRADYLEAVPSDRR